MTFHTTLHHSIAILSSTEFSRLLSSSAVNKCVQVISDTMTCGKDLPLENLWKVRRKISTDRLVTTSRCTALMVAYVNRHIPCLSVVLYDVQCPREIYTHYRKG